MRYGHGTGDLSDMQMGELHSIVPPPNATLCKSPSGHCDQTTCVVSGKCAWQGADKPQHTCCGHVHASDAGGFCKECPDVGTTQFWAGDFGNAYTERNQGADILAARIAMFSRILERAPGVNSVIELGANTGINLKAISVLRPHAKLWGVEVNAEAALQIPVGTAIIRSILDYGPLEPCDLAFTRGVLIHVAPEDLPRAYDALYEASRRYIMIAEYFDPNPTMVPYRGHDNKLWKRDFAGEMLDRFKDLCLIDCAFVYKRGDFAQDSITWFLMEKR